MSKKVKIYRLLKKVDNELETNEVAFLNQIYGMYSVGKHNLISKKQHNWLDKILGK